MMKRLFLITVILLANAPAFSQEYLNVTDDYEVKMARALHLDR